MSEMQLTFGYADLPAPKQSSEYFLLSDQWIKLRYRTLMARGNHCECCGRSWTIGNPLQVDHIKPRSKFPHLALDPNNLQVMCRECNLGKGAWDATDWRRPP
jgi:5-methylcytosine-specific restriction endonuclease McrA